MTDSPNHKEGSPQILCPELQMEQDLRRERSFRPFYCVTAEDVVRTFNDFDERALSESP